MPHKTSRPHLPPSDHLTKGLMYVLQRLQRTMPPLSRPMTGTSWGSASGCTTAPKGNWYRCRMDCRRHTFHSQVACMSLRCCQLFIPVRPTPCESRFGTFHKPT